MAIVYAGDLSQNHDVKCVLISHSVRYGGINVRLCRKNEYILPFALHLHARMKAHSMKGQAI